MIDRSVQIWRSLRSLPLWVQVWVVGILVPVNAAPFFFTDTWIGVAGSVAALFVVATNLPIMYHAGGMTRLMSIPHLFAWGPLQVAIALRLMGWVGEATVTSAEWWLGIVLFAVNGISLVFDALDSWRWLRGEREVPGATQTRS